MSREPDVIIYTDGACSGNPGPGGWAAILQHPATGRAKKISGGEMVTTNNRMELTAAIKALQALKGGKRRAVRLVTDSEYMVKGMSEWLPRWIANDWRRGRKAGAKPVMNADLWQQLHELCTAHDVTFEHVRGHSGHPENEECDRMAVAAIEEIRRQRR